MLSKPVAKQQILTLEKEDITVVEKVVSSEKEKLFEKKPIPEIHETIQEVDIPCLIHSNSEIQSSKPELVIINDLSDEV